MVSLAAVVRMRVHRPIWLGFRSIEVEPHALVYCSSAIALGMSTKKISIQKIRNGYKQQIKQMRKAKQLCAKHLYAIF